MSQNRYSIDALKAVLQKELGKPLSSANLQMLKLAFHGHTGQFRESVSKDQQIPYIVHPVGVAVLVIKHYDLVKKQVKEDLDTLISVALAHDLIEDTRITFSQIRAIAGPHAERLVESMTKLPNPNHVSFLKRKEEITTRTLAAGSGAVFVRACDSMHNLSWPQITPLKILIKGVIRAREVYAPLLDKIKMNEEFKAHYHEKIATADTYAKSKIEEKDKKNEIPRTIGEVIAMCASFTHKKVLEIHDIVEVLQNITGADSISTWTPYGKTENYFKPSFSIGKPKKFVEKIKESSIDFITQQLHNKNINKFIEDPESNGKYFLLTLRISINCRYLILLSFEEAELPQWLSVTNLEFVIDSLSERLIVTNSDYKRSLVTVASGLGMNFEVDWADHLAIEPANLIQLQKMQKRCNQAIRHVLHACEMFFEQEAEKNPLRDLIKVESRVKETRSIMRKFLPPSQLQWPHFNELPDIAGVRVICPTKRWVTSLRKFLSSPKMNAYGIRLSKTHESKDYTKNPTLKGYRALHLVLDVDTFLDKKKVIVPCEVQIQTMVQDVWAKIAHKITYKQDDRSNAMDDVQHQLRDIGHNLDNFDQLIDKITEERRRIL